MRLADHLVNTWYAPRPTLLAVALLPLAGVFGIVAAARRGLYAARVLPRHRARVPVIVVGNITAGGAGKTPLVIALADALRARGWHPGVISRGTGGSGSEPRLVGRDDSADRVGDEPLLMARRGLAVAVGRRRARAAAHLLDRHPEIDVLLADDGLQHYGLARAVEVAVVDGTRQLGNGLLLPAGPLREPRARLTRVDAVVVNGAAVAGLPRLPEMTHAMTLRPDVFVNVSDARHVVPATHFSGTAAHAVAGIAHPERFFATLRALGVEVTAHSFPDHHRYVPADLAWPGTGPLLMTEKDAVKCTRFAEARCWYLRMDAEIDDALVEHLIARLRASGAGHAA